MKTIRFEVEIPEDTCFKCSYCYNSYGEYYCRLFDKPLRRYLTKKNIYTLNRLADCVKAEVKEPKE